MMLRCSAEAFARCPTARLCGCLEEATFTEGSECDRFNQNVERHEVQTNADRIRAMSDEELAEEIMCPYGMEEGMCTKPSDCLSCCLEWLRQPVQPTLDAPDAHEHSGLLED